METNKKDTPSNVNLQLNKKEKRSIKKFYILNSNLIESSKIIEKLDHISNEKKQKSVLEIQKLSDLNSNIDQQYPELKLAELKGIPSSFLGKIKVGIIFPILLTYIIQLFLFLITYPSNWTYWVIVIGFFVSWVFYPGSRYENLAKELNYNTFRTATFMGLIIPFYYDLVSRDFPLFYNFPIWDLHIFINFGNVAIIGGLIGGFIAIIFEVLRVNFEKKGYIPFVENKLIPWYENKIKPWFIKKRDKFKGKFDDDYQI